jgi:hypothetical protein
VARLDELADRRIARQRRIGARQDQVGLRRRDGIEDEALLAHRPLQNLEHGGGGREAVLDGTVSLNRGAGVCKLRLKGNGSTEPFLAIGGRNWQTRPVARFALRAPHLAMSSAQSLR